MVELIAKREGIGDILADGSRKAAERIGQGSEEFAMHVKGLEFPMHDPRVKQGLGIMYSVEAVGADHCAGFHDPMFTTESVAFTRLRALGARRPLPADDLSADKVANAKANHIKSMFGDSMVCCSFVPWSLDQQVEILNAATGWSYSIHEVYELGQRIATLGRIFNMREGMTAADDVMPKRMFEPTPTGGLKDGGIDKTQMDAAVKTFYGMMGWDEVTGVPTNGKLSELNISWAAEHIPADRSALSR
jgi:aldehyde:ferredoxin oxidoreductase